MKDELQHTQGFFSSISDQIHYWMRDHVSPEWVLFSQVTVKILFFIATIAVADLLFRIILRGTHTLFYRKFKEHPFITALYESKVLNSIANFLALGIGMYLIQSILGRHPNSHGLVGRILSVAMIIAGYTLYKRILTTIEKFFFLKQDFYRITAFRAVTSTLQIVGYLVFGFIGITIIFGVSPSTILGTLGAMTAVILLIFRDTILGLVTGIHVSTSRTVKVGDWIGIPKYNLEGNITDINLMTTRIQNFDKSFSTIPTYDLVSTEIRNLQVISEGNSRRIKRSMVFNVKSFRFLDSELLEHLQKINLLKSYLAEKELEINSIRKNIPNSDELVNGRQLTNIGVFRTYVQLYLQQNKNIDFDNTVMVRQLEVTSAGMPLEIYCFTKTSNWKEFETIQADIFDHLLAAVKDFDLEIMQVNKI